MKKIILFFVFVFLISITACTRQSNDSPFAIDIYKIESELFLDENLLLDPWNVLFFDSMIIIANDKGEPLIEVYDNQGVNIDKFLTIGNGPEEVLTVGGLQASFTNNNIYIFDLFKKWFLEFNLKNISQSDFKPDTIHNFSSYLYQKDSTVLFSKLLLGKDCLIGESRDPRGRIALIDFDGAIINFGGHYPPNTHEGLSEYAYTNLFASSFVLNNNASRLAMATYSADMIDIFDLSDHSNLQTVWSYQGFLPHDIYVINLENFHQAAFTQESQQGYSDIRSSDKYIYALYSGKKMSDKSYNYGNIIRVMDWDGEKRFELHTDIDVKRITVSPDDKHLYAIAKDEDDNPIIVYFNIDRIIENIN